jgi:hypothetical protein
MPKKDKDKNPAQSRGMLDRIAHCRFYSLCALGIVETTISVRPDR